MNRTSMGRPHDDALPDVRSLWRVAWSGVVAVCTFVLVLAITARLTRDGAGGVPRGAPSDVASGSAVMANSPGIVLPAAPQVDTDAGGSADAGPIDGPGRSDGGTAWTVPLEPDAGPVAAAGPPVALDEVQSALTPVLERCLRDALRFDPSLGGRVDLEMVAQDGVLRAQLRGAPSPVLATCLETGARAVPISGARDEVVHLEARVVLDGLRGLVRWFSLDVVPGEPPR